MEKDFLKMTALVLSCSIIGNVALGMDQAARAAERQEIRSEFSPVNPEKLFGDDKVFCTLITDLNREFATLKPEMEIEVLNNLENLRAHLERLDAEVEEKQHELDDLIAEVARKRQIALEIRQEILDRLKALLAEQNA
ncbi:MAG: hypothetical protein LBF54_03510 [Holosporaceae bacterium]|jgi:hypothetical protein|nr:hypothetical protein [Holosporaceae bacterium]